MIGLKKFFSDDETFYAWGHEIDLLLRQKYGLGILDLNDQTYAKFFDDKKTPEEAFNEIVKNLHEEWDW